MFTNMQKGGYETVLILLIALTSTFLVSGLPWNGLKKLTAPGELLSQIIQTPQPSHTRHALTVSEMKIQSTWLQGSATTTLVCPDPSHPLPRNVTFTNELDSDPQELALVQKTICGLEQVKFMTYINNTRINIFYTDHQRNNSTEIGNCGGFTEPDPDHGGYAVQFSPCDKEVGRKTTLIHELGHVIRFTNHSIYSQFCNKVYKGTYSEDTCSFDPTQVKTIPAYNCVGKGPNPEECFPDMLGAYYTYKDWAGTISSTVGGNPSDYTKMLDYPHNFPDYYTFAEKNFFTSETTSCDPKKELCAE